MSARGQRVRTNVSRERTSFGLGLFALAGEWRIDVLRDATEPGVSSASGR